MWIDAIQLNYTDGTNYYKSDNFGGNGGSPKFFDIPNGQYILSINICKDTSHLTKIQFTTNQGLQSPIYGTNIDGAICKTINLPSKLLGIGGYYGSYLQALYFITFNTTTLTTTASTTTTTTITTTSTTTSTITTTSTTTITATTPTTRTNGNHIIRHFYFILFLKPIFIERSFNEINIFNFNFSLHFLPNKLE